MGRAVSLTKATAPWFSKLGRGKPKRAALSRPVWPVRSQSALNVIDDKEAVRRARANLRCRNFGADGAKLIFGAQRMRFGTRLRYVG